MIVNHTGGSNEWAEGSEKLGRFLWYRKGKIWEVNTYQVATSKSQFSELGVCK